MWVLLALVCVLTVTALVLAVALVRGERREGAQSPTTTSASASATPRHHRPVPVSALDALLPDSGVVSAAMREPDIGLVAHGDGIATDVAVDADCQGVTGPASRDYAGSGWTAVRWQVWNSPAALEPPKLWKHVSVTVATYPQADAARSFYTSESASWRRCNLRIVNGRSANATESPDSFWYVDKVSDSDGVLSATTANAQGNGWSCQNRLTVRNNVAVRVTVCGYSPPDAAARTLVDTITRKVDAAS